MHESQNLDAHARDLVDREVMVCVSSLVSTLARGWDVPMLGGDDEPREALLDLCEQAAALAAPVLDYEEAAAQAGWEKRDLDGTPHWFPAGSSMDYVNAVETAEDACDAAEVEPYEWEVFEHWAVSGWLADELEKRGERIDRDFSGLIVWARMTTGQAIYCDKVIRDIARDLWSDAGEERK